MGTGSREENASNQKTEGPLLIQSEPDRLQLAVCRAHHDMFRMKRPLIIASVAIAGLAIPAIAADVAYAQIFQPAPGGPLFTPPPPPSPPPPKIEVPKVPQMDEVPRQNYQPPPRASFSDRVTKCLDDAAASGLGANDRETYARGCANGR